MRRFTVLSLGYLVAFVGTGLGQRGGPEWTTANMNAQRTGSIATDPRISQASITGKPGFQYLWKIKFDDEPRQLNTLSPVVTVGSIISYRGFKSLGFLVSSSGNVYAFDSDLGRMYWQTHLTWGSTTKMQEGGTLTCPGGLTANMTRPTPAMPPAGGGRGGGGGGGGRAPLVPGAPGAPGAPDAAAARRGGGGGGGGGRGPVIGPAGFNDTMAVLTVGSDGRAFVMNMHAGNTLTAPVGFLPPNSNPNGLIYTDDVLYAITSGNCGGAANGIWAVNLASPEKTVSSWKSNGGDLIASPGPAMSTNGTLYLATGDGAYGPGSYSDSVVALAPKTLELKDWFSPAKSDFIATPVVFEHGGKQLLAAANRDGRLYLLDTASLGGADHHTPLAKSAPYSAGNGDVGALAAWSVNGTQYVAAPFTGASANGSVTNGGIAAFRVVDQSGAPTLQPAWFSRDMTSPLPPIFVNGVVIALASGEYRTNEAQMTAAERARHSGHAILYVLDAETGKELWNSGDTIRSFTHGGSLAAASGSVFFTTYDETLWAFGVPLNISGNPTAGN